MKKVKQSMSSSELKKFWNAFQSDYTAYGEQNMFPSMAAMCNLTRIKKLLSSGSEPVNILELSAGSGVGLQYIYNTAQNLQSLHKRPVNIYGGDISPDMVNVAYQRFQGIPNLSIKTGDSATKDTENNSKNSENATDKQSHINVNLLECDNEDLKFADKKFNVVSLITR